MPKEFSTYIFMYTFCPSARFARHVAIPSRSDALASSAFRFSGAFTTCLKKISYNFNSIVIPSLY